MAIRIPLKAVAFVVYTLALFGGAFGISYAVFEWRDGGSSECNIARKTFYEGLITPDVDREILSTLYDYLEEECD